MDDTGIIELYFNRDEQAIRETGKKYGKLCHSIAYNILNSHEDSEECVNDTYAGIWNAIPPARPNNFMAFVCKIARNLSLRRLEFLKREKRSRDAVVSLEELEAVLPDERIASDVSDEELGQLISRFLRSQKEEVRNVFIRKYYFFDSIYKVLLSDLRARRCLECFDIKLGDTVGVKYEGMISENNEIDGAYSIYEGTLVDGDLSVAE